MYLGQPREDHPSKTASEGPCRRQRCRIHFPRSGGTADQFLKDAGLRPELERHSPGPRISVRPATGKSDVDSPHGSLGLTAPREPRPGVGACVAPNIEGFREGNGPVSRLDRLLPDMWFTASPRIRQESPASHGGRAPGGTHIEISISQPPAPGLTLAPASERQQDRGRKPRSHP